MNTRGTDAPTTPFGRNMLGDFTHDPTESLEVVELPYDFINSKVKVSYLRVAHEFFKYTQLKTHLPSGRRTVRAFSNFGKR